MSEQNGSTPNLRRGDSGPAVERWQKILGVAADGQFGPATEAATKAFQARSGLHADGVVGRATWAAGLAAPAPAPAVPAGERLAAVRTRIDPVDLYHSLCALEPGLSRAAVLVLLGHWGLETGDGAGCWSYNLGNVKAKPGGRYSWQFFACNEVLTPVQANAIVSRALPREPRRAEDDPAAFGRPEFDKVTVSAVTSSTTKDGKVILWAFPPDPVCCFRAFTSLDEGAADYLAILKKRFSDCWKFVEAGDAAGFSRALRKQGYYTADEGQYTKGLIARRDKFAKLIV